MKRAIAYSLILVLAFISVAPFVSVHAGYVLPYPSFMPGNKLYAVSRIMDRVQYFWHWGDIARARYYMALSDTYLVEAKTLMEYRQYLLGRDALIRSDAAFSGILPHIRKAEANGKDTSVLLGMHKEEALMHTQVLMRLTESLPEEFEWRPEKDEPQTLKLHDVINESLQLRVWQ